MRAMPIGLMMSMVATLPALAQPNPGLPANPFASNYPSEPPQMRPDRLHGASPLRRRVRSGRTGSTGGLLPPAEIPGGRRPR